MRLRFILAVAALGLLAGCGGGGTGGGAGPAPAASKSEARFDVDLKTGKVTITPAGGRAVFQGGAVSFTSSDVLSVSGDAGQRLIRVAARNNSGQTWGGSPVRMTVSDVANADAAAIRASVAVTTYAGNGGTGAFDGYRTLVPMGQMAGLCRGEGPLSGSLLVASGQAVRRIDPTGSVTTLAGSYVAAGAVEGTGPSARFSSPMDLACDAVGNVFVADAGNHKIRRVTPLGETTTIAGTGVPGTGDGTGAVATLDYPWGLAVSPDGNRIYVVDYLSDVVRLIRFTGSARESAASYTVSTVAGAAYIPGFLEGSLARFRAPARVVLMTDPTGVETLFVVDTGNHAVRRVANPAGVATVSTVAGDGVAGDTDGPGSVARLRSPLGVAGQWLDSSSYVLFVTDNNRVRAISYAAGGSPTQKGSYDVLTIAGTSAAGSVTGDGNAARFNQPNGIAALGAGSAATLYVADWGNNFVRQVNVPGGALHSGGGAPASAETVRLLNGDAELPNRTAWTRTLTESSGVWKADLQFNVPAGVSGFSFLATIETDANLVNLPAVGASTVSTLAGGSLTAFSDGPARVALFASPHGVVAVPASMRGLYRSPSGAPIRAFIMDTQNRRVRFVDTAGYVGVWAGSTIGTADGAGAAAQFTAAYAGALAPDGSLIVTDANRIRRVWPNQQVTTVAGIGTAGSADGAGSVAQFYLPYGVAVTSGWQIYIADAQNHTIRRIMLTGADPRSASSYTVATVAGLAGVPGAVDGTGSAVRLNYPTGMAADSDGRVYVADTGNGYVRIISPRSDVDVAISTLSNCGGAPTAVTVDAAQNVYVALFAYKQICRVSPSGALYIIAGTGTQGFTEGPTGQLWGPNGLAIEETGALLFTDYHALRSVSRIVDAAAP